MFAVPDTLKQSAAASKPWRLGPYIVRPRHGKARRDMHLLSRVSTGAFAQSIKQFTKCSLDPTAGADAKQPSIASQYSLGRSASAEFILDASRPGTSNAALRSSAVDI